MEYITLRTVRDIDHHTVVELVYIPEECIWESARIAASSEPFTDTAQTSGEYFQQSTQYIKQVVPEMLARLPSDIQLVIPRIYLESFAKYGVTAEDIKAKPAEDEKLMSGFSDYHFSDYSKALLVSAAPTPAVAPTAPVAATTGKVAKVLTNSAGGKVRKSDVARGLIKDNKSKEPKDRLTEQEVINLIATTCDLSPSIAKSYYKNNVEKV